MSEGTKAIEGTDARSDQLVCIAAEAHVPALRAALAVTMPGAEVVSSERVELSLQHMLNNPLTALLAEAQLLEMDSLEPEQREAVERIVAMCRRTVGAVRSLSLARAASQ